MKVFRFVREELSWGGAVFGWLDARWECCPSLFDVPGPFSLMPSLPSGLFALSTPQKGLDLQSTSLHLLGFVLLSVCLSSFPFFLPLSNSPLSSSFFTFHPPPSHFLYKVFYLKKKKKWNSLCTCTFVTGASDERTTWITSNTVKILTYILDLDKSANSSKRF